MGRREQRAQRMRDEARGVDTRTGEIPEYACPPRLLAPAVVEEWLTVEELDALSEAEAMIRARRRWVDARDDFTREQTSDDHGLRARVAQLCGPVSRPVWRDELGEPWHVRQP
ncbi:hypothetical protein ACFYWX_10680 [Streptomyces sp. NPDC002888]|uniref:hypothetical protein n=1 Tax=Streptomyces sp. NPDC002888 TaxID=3364668 RepID=UPI0036B7C7EF